MPSAHPKPRPWRVALTGVPGTGKTTIAEGLLARGVGIVDLHAFARGTGMLGAKDRARDSFIVDTPRLAKRLDGALASLEDDRLVIEGHFAHEMRVDAIVLLRCDPLVLAKRLRGRGWAEPKVRENVEAEALDVLAAEVLDRGLPAVELDVSRIPVEEAARKIWGIVVGGPEAFKGKRVGSAHWSLESLPWS